jgi:hypothetical protein
MKKIILSTASIIFTGVILVRSLINNLFFQSRTSGVPRGGLKI